MHHQRRNGGVNGDLVVLSIAQRRNDFPPGHDFLPLEAALACTLDRDPQELLEAAGRAQNASKSRCAEERSGESTLKRRDFFAYPLIGMAAWNRPVQAKSFSDVEFSHPSGNSLQFDAQVPDGKGPFPAAIIVHGGAWVTGDRRRSVEPLFRLLTNSGIAWFSISYRLADIGDQRSLATLAASTATLDSAVDDVKSAVAFLRTHASDYNLDRNRIALIGESAGAQLAAMAALKSPASQGVQAVVAFYCPSNLVTLAQTLSLIPDSIRQAVKGTPLEQMLMARMRELSPITWVEPGAPPFLLIHGTADSLVPFQQSVDFCSALSASGSACELFPVEGAGHGLRWWEGNNRLSAYKPHLVQWLSDKLMLR